MPLTLDTSVRRRSRRTLISSNRTPRRKLWAAQIDTVSDAPPNGGSWKPGDESTAKTEILPNGTKRPDALGRPALGFVISRPSVQVRSPALYAAIEIKITSDPQELQAAQVPEKCNAPGRFGRLGPGIATTLGPSGVSLTILRPWFTRLLPALRTLLCIVCDLLTLVSTAVRSRAQLAGENLFLSQ